MEEQVEKAEKEIQDFCSECGSINLIHDFDTGETVCGDCGLVIDGLMMDKGPEWRAFSPEQTAKRSRVGAPLTYAIHDKGLFTVIDWHDFDIFGKRLTPGQKAQVYRLRKWQYRSRVHDSADRSLSNALPEISRIADNLDLPKNVFQTASFIYRKVVKEHLIRGRSVQHLVVASIYMACRQCNLTKTLEEIARATGIDKKEISRNYRLLIKKFDYLVPLQKPEDFITKYSEQLQMGRVTEDIAHKILNTAREIRLTSGKAPTGMGAAASYIASQLSGEKTLSGEKITQRKIADMYEVTEVTVRNRYRELKERLLFIVSI